MLRSMTGYGNSQKEEAGQKINIEIRTLNHRFLDISIKMPKQLFLLEEKMKKMVKSYCSRGRVEVFINLDFPITTNKKVKIDWTLLDQYMNELKLAKNKHNLSGNVSVEMLAQLEGLFILEEKEDLNQKEWEQELLAQFKVSLQQVVAMRKMEGEELARDLMARVDQMKNYIKQLGDCRDTVIMEYQERIKKRIDTYIKEPFSAEESRILQEVAILAEKGDITEELTRLFSHIHQFSESLKSESAVGRRLDFIVQEMHREVNTIGSKSMDSRISELIVVLKSDIEKIKEQVQNIE